MVSAWLARRLARFAARRWPCELRDELRKEWLAELHALREERNGGLRALRFAASLAARRPSRPPRLSRPPVPRAVAYEHHPLRLMVAPFPLLLLGQAATVIVLSLLGAPLSWVGWDGAARAGWFAYAFVAAVLLGAAGVRLGATSGWDDASKRGGPARLALRVTVAVALGLLAAGAFGLFDDDAAHAWAGGVWAGSFAAVALLVARTRSWPLAVAGVPLVGGIAVTVALLLSVSQLGFRW